MAATRFPHGFAVTASEAFAGAEAALERLDRLMQTIDESTMPRPLVADPPPPRGVEARLRIERAAAAYAKTMRAHGQGLGPVAPGQNGLIGFVCAMNEFANVMREDQ